MNEHQNRQFIKALALKWKDGTITDEEKQLFNQWYHSFEDPAIADLTDENPQDVKERIYQHIALSENLSSSGNSDGRKWFSTYYIAAVMALVFGAFGFFFYQSKQTSHQSELTAQQKKQIPPGGNKAVLTLADGSSVPLSQDHKGILTTQGTVAISNSTEGTVNYAIAVKADPSASKTQFNMITTPRGGQYQVNLSDGTKVWLNAASSIRFPVTFSKDRREVELTGEAYFEVNPTYQKGKKSKVPFFVKTKNQTVEVMGTHFNINAYEDEHGTKTTLLEGAVKVLHGTSKNAAILKPGQQAVTDAGQTRVLNVDVSQYVAWQEGYFVFDDESAESMMRQVSRWYDVDIVYSGNIRYRKFGGRISRFENLSEILHLMEKTGVIHFRTEGRRVIVMP